MLLKRGTLGGRQMANSDAWSYTVLVSGTANHIRNVSLPLAEGLQREFPDHESVPSTHREATSPLFLKGRLQNAASAVDVMVGILVFLGTWGAKRVLDDVYEVKIRPRFRALLGEKLPKIDDTRRPAIAPRRHHCALVAIWHEKVQRAVVVAAVGASPEEVLVNEDAVVRTHIAADDTLDDLPSTAPVVLYVVEQGKAGPALTFSSLEEAMRHLALPREVKPTSDSE